MSSDEVIINGLTEKDLLKMAETTERKMSMFFKEYPCLCFIRDEERDYSGIKEICFNEQYINELGYSLESFATTVLQEGIPR